MFQNCNELKCLDLSNFDTSNVINMACMFNGCNKLKEINGINKLITNNVEDMGGMFQDCNELEHLDLSNFNTSKVTNMICMFCACLKLKEIKGINKFKTNKAKSMKAMFQFCTELEHLDLSNFNTSNVTEMDFMFLQCNKLQYLNLSNFEINCTKEEMLSFESSQCVFITNNQKLLDLYYQNFDYSNLLI